MRKIIRTITVVSLLAAPLALAAQGTARRPAGPGGPGGPAAPMAHRAPQDPGVTQILNARRVLELTPRQVAQLDSIERSLFTERRATEQRVRALTDSVRTASRARAEQNQGSASEAPRDSMRQRMESMRPQMERLRSRDSVSRAAAMRILNDGQRQQLREIQAEERGRQRGMMEARARSQHGARPGAAHGNVRRGDRGDRGEMHGRSERETEVRREMDHRRPDARPEGDAPGK